MPPSLLLNMRDVDSAHLHVFMLKYVLLAESAKEYAKQRLYGARLKRSTAMLQPVGRSKMRI